MDIGCQTYSLRHCTLAETLSGARKAGFRSVELWAGHAPWAAGVDAAREVRGLADQVGLALRSYSVGGFVRVAVARVEQELDAAFAYATALGVELVTGVIDRRAVPVADRLCRRTGLRFAIENHWYADFARADDYVPALDAASDRVGVALDTGHLAVAGDDPIAALDVLGARVFDVHVKDVTVPGRLARWLQRKPRMECRTLGSGQVGVAALLAALAARDYAGYVVIEDERPRLPLSELQRSLRAATGFVRAAHAPAIDGACTVASIPAG